MLQEQANPLPWKLGLHERICIKPFPVGHHDGFTDENLRKEAPYQMMFADDMVKDMLELEMEQREERNESVKSKDQVHVPEWKAIGKLESA